MHYSQSGLIAQNNSPMSCLLNSSIPGSGPQGAACWDTALGEGLHNTEDQLIAPNRFIEDWVKSKFLSRIEALFSVWRR